jgi:hypothetical protein
VRQYDVDILFSGYAAYRRNHVIDISCLDALMDRKMEQAMAETTSSSRNIFVLLLPTPIWDSPVLEYAKQLFDILDKEWAHVRYRLFAKFVYERPTSIQFRKTLDKVHKIFSAPLSDIPVIQIEKKFIRQIIPRHIEMLGIEPFVPP